MAERNDMTEIDLLVGSMCTTSPKEDRETYEEEQSWLSDIQELLLEEGIEVDLLSRPGVEIWEGGIARFNDLYSLRLAAARLEEGHGVGELPDVDDVETPDPVLVAIFEGTKPTRFAHLINHQGEGGYYLPVDFPEPIWIEFGDDEEFDDEESSDDEPEDMVVSFGSSVGLQRELLELESLLERDGVSAEHRIVRCLRVLRNAADQSVANELPITVW
jgi:hypothetical protein